MIKITLPDGSVKEFEQGITPYEVAQSISEGLARNVLVAKVNDQMVELDKPIREDATLTLFTWNDREGKDTFWHSSAHLMAAAIESLYPGVKFGIGPHIETGFYYDIDFMDYPISSEDFPKIEEKMKELAAQKIQFVRREVPKAEALDYFQKKGDEYKLELIDGLEDGQISFYESGPFTDLCRGPHLHDTSAIKAIKLLKTAGAYWRGDEKRKQLTRIYAVTFPKKKELDEYLALLEEAAKRDHRKLGREMELFTFSPLVGQGLPLWLPKGAALRDRLEQFLRKVQKKYGYQQVITPHIGNVNLYKTSGHYAKYGADSFRPITTPQEGEEFFLKPMNCPHHCQIFAARPRSYKELPLRLAEFGTVYRYEQSGELHGLTRVRGFTQDDAHLYCTADQIKEEFCKVIDIILYIFKTLKFENYKAQVSLRDPNNKEKYIGTDENWEKAQLAIIEAAFYGPKLDFMVKDAIGREWQLGTVQVDYNLPERFELEYTDADGQKKRPVMIHRAPFGSMERFVAVLLEHTGGNFPLWLTSDQVVILPISEKYMDYARKVQAALDEQDIRCYIDERSEKTGRKIRDAETAKVPYMLIVGEKEEEEGTVSVRRHGNLNDGSMPLNDFVALIKKAIEEELEN